MNGNVSTDPPSPGRRILCLKLTCWPVDRLRATQGLPVRAGVSPDVPEPPFALVDEAGRGLTLYALNEAARRSGLSPGQALADARALCPELATWPADPKADRKALAGLARWATRWTPWAAPRPPDTILMDVTGCAHLFGGEEELLADVAARIEALGFSARAALADTVGGAWAIATCDADPHVPCPPGGLEVRLRPLPIAALRLEPAALATLSRLGITTIGQLLDTPRAPLGRRFARRPGAADLLCRLDQALGRLSEPVSPSLSRPRLRVLERLAEPVAEAGTIARLTGVLARRLAERLAAAGRGARRLHLTAFRADGGAARLRVDASRPTRDADHMLRLFRDRIERLEAGFGFDALALEAVATEPLAAEQDRLMRGASPGPDLDRLVDRLTARLGPARVLRPLPRESHLPERAQLWASAVDAAAALRASWSVPAHEPRRPLRLFDPPEPVEVIYEVPEGPPARLVWRRMRRRIVAAAGPERIAPEWWREPGRARLRDYFEVEDETGRRYWLYREGHYGDGRGGPPEWFLHGLFP